MFVVQLKGRGVHKTITNIFEADRVLFPIHVGSDHWAVFCVDFRRKVLEYFDSMKHDGDVEYFTVCFMKFMSVFLSFIYM